MAKTVAPIIDELTRQARRDTLNKRINYKGNYENYITGGSHALNNQAYNDTNEFARAMANPNSGWASEEWLGELNDRYTNPQHNEKAGNSPVGSGLKYIHRYTPSTRRGRRASDIWFREGMNGKARTPEDLRFIQDLVGKYEGVK